VSRRGVEPVTARVRVTGQQGETGAGRVGRTAWRWTRLAGGAAILAVLVERLGPGPFLDGARAVGPAPLLVATGVTALTTTCCAWRWRLVARGLGLELPLLAAVAACYRSQFLNLALPGGVLGDVHRAVRHGWGAADLGRSARSVVWERSAGQVVQVALTLPVLFLLPTPLRPALPLLVAVLTGAGLLLVGARQLAVRGPSRSAARIVGAVEGDVRRAVLARGLWPGIVVASALAVAGHTVLLLVAARATGVPAGAATLLPLALVVLAASALPLSVAGWGPREGAAAWAFAAAGLGAAEGAATAVAYGVMVLASALPGAVLLLARPPARASAVPTAPADVEVAAHG
jgi:hypothetical protein